MTRIFVLPLLLALSAAAPASAPASPDEVNAVALLAGARIHYPDDGGGDGDAGSLCDGLFAEAHHEWVPVRYDPTLTRIIELAEPFDLSRVAVVNSSESGGAGIAVKKLKLEHGQAINGPFKPLAELSLKRGKAVQKFGLPATKNVRFLRLTLLENYGNESFWGLAELSVFGRRSKPRANVSFTGKYETGMGSVVLTQQGQRVTGCAGSIGETLLDGTADGSVFSGTFDDGNTRGTVAFVLTAEGGLSGVYGDEGAEVHLSRWDGTPSTEVAITCRSPEKKLAGELKARGRIALRGILFDTGKDVIRGESLPVLESLAGAMKEDPKAKYLIEGHTDNRGGEAFNQQLSEKRAAAVKRWLAEHGIAEKRLTTRGFGQSKPALPNDSEAGRAANRRVEVATVPPAAGASKDP